MSAMPLELAPFLFTLGAAAVRMVRPVHGNVLLWDLHFMSGTSFQKASATYCKMDFSNARCCMHKPDADCLARRT